jgi:hypothetical protein
MWMCVSVAVQAHSRFRARALRFRAITCTHEITFCAYLSVASSTICVSTLPASGVSTASSWHRIWMICAMSASR